jgi:hypothetical protein
MILQEALALSSMFTRGNGDEVRAAIERGLAIAETFEDRDHQLQLLAGLNIFLTRIGDFRGALTVAENGVSVARAAKNPAGLVMTDWMLGVSHHLVGNQAAAQRHCEYGMVRAVELGQLNTNFFGYDHRIRALVTLARALWLRGFSEQALGTAQQAIDEAQRRDHPVSVCISLIYAGSVFLWRGDFGRAADFIERLIAYAGRYSLEPYRAVGIALKGELAVTRDEAGAGLMLLRTGLESLRAEQHHILATVFEDGQRDQARDTLAPVYDRFTEGFETADLHIARALIHDLA